MKKILQLNLMILLLCFFSCSEDTKDSPDVGKDVRTSTPVHDMRVDVQPVDMKDSGNTNSLNLERKSKNPCANNQECERGSVCDSGLKLCLSSDGCAFFRAPDPQDPEGCLILENGVTTNTDSECKDDTQCPSTFPYCFFNVCQQFAPCKMDSDCSGEEKCLDDSWCQVPQCKVDTDCKPEQLCVNGNWCR